MPFPEMSMRRLGLTAAAAALAITVAGTAAAQSMVVRSTGPSASKYPTGMKLKSTDKVTLVKGDRVVLMQAGKTRTLSAPGTYPASGNVQVSQSMGTTVSRMLASGPTGRMRGGATRSGELTTPTPAAMHAPNLWLLDYREAGTFCVVDPATLVLWRPEMETKQMLRIDRGEQSAYLDIPEGANFRKWPTETMPVQFGVDYRLSGAGLAAPVTVRFTSMGPIPDSADASVDALLSKGCTPQLNRLVDAMAEAEATGG